MLAVVVEEQVLLEQLQQVLLGAMVELVLHHQFQVHLLLMLVEEVAALIQLLVLEVLEVAVLVELETQLELI
jgi:hypothetical protein